MESRETHPFRLSRQRQRVHSGSSAGTICFRLSDAVLRTTLGADRQGRQLLKQKRVP